MACVNETRMIVSFVVMAILFIGMQATTPWIEVKPIKMTDCNSPSAFTYIQTPKAEFRKTLSDKNKQYIVDREAARATVHDDLYAQLKREQKQNKELEECNEIATMENFNSDIALGIMTVGGIKYTPEDRLGSGAFGTVFKGIGSNGIPVAIKHQYHREDNNEVQIMSEYRIHKDLSAVDKIGYVVKMIGMQEYPESVVMIMEFASTSLHSLLGTVTRVQVQKYFRKLIHGVEFLHSNHVVHCDLSLKNLLLSNGELKIADFGRAKRLLKKDQVFPSTECRGTPKFCAPEVCDRELVPVKPYPLDVWSCGIVLMQLTQNSEQSWREAKVQIKEYDRWVAKKKTDSDFWSDIPSVVLNLLRKILEVDISKRATIEDIKKSPYFKKDEKEPVKRSGVSTRSSAPKRGRY